MGVDDLFFECRRGGQQLESRTRLVGITDDRITPQTDEIALLFVRGHFFICLRLRLRHIFAVHRLIRIIARCRGTCQNLPGLWVHDQAQDALGFGFFHPLFQCLFHIILNGLIQTQHDIVAVLRLVIFLRALDQLVAEQIGVLFPSAGYACKILVIFQLDACASRIVRADAAPS